jgi:hypothetical protein
MTKDKKQPKPLPNVEYYDSVMTVKVELSRISCKIHHNGLSEQGSRTWRLVEIGGGTKLPPRKMAIMAVTATMVTKMGSDPRLIHRSVGGGY